MSARLARLREMQAWVQAEIRDEVERMSALGGEMILARACALYGADTDAVLRGSRKLQDVRARQAASWMLRRNGLSFPQIGSILGVDHTTVLHSCRKVEASPGTRALLLGLEVVA